MVRGILILCLTTSALVSGYFAVHKPQIAPAKPFGLTISPQIAQLGNISQNTSRIVRFEITNHDSGVVAIQDVHSGCSCTKLTLGQKELRKGESTTLEVEFDAGNSRGLVRRSVDLLYMAEDGLLRHRELAFEVEVLADILLAPGELLFTAGRAAQLDLELRNGQLADFRIESVAATHSSVNVVQSATDARKLIVTYTPSADRGEFDRDVSILVRTTSKNEPQLFVPVRFAEPRSPGER